MARVFALIYRLLMHPRMTTYIIKVIMYNVRSTCNYYNMMVYNSWATVWCYITPEYKDVSDQSENTEYGCSILEMQSLSSITVSTSHLLACSCRCIIGQSAQDVNSYSFVFAKKLSLAWWPNFWDDEKYHIGYHQTNNSHIVKS